MEEKDATRVLIAGGGFAGVEAAMYLVHRLGKRAQVTLMAAADRFLFRPFLSYVPFGLVEEELEIDLQAVAQAQGFVFLQGRVEAVQPEQRRLVVDGETMDFDHLVIATGAASGPPSVPGLAEHGHILWQATDMKRLRHAFQKLLRASEAGSCCRVLFMVPPDCLWAGPLYEMLFMLAAWLQWQGARSQVDLALLSAEEAHLSVLGADVHDVLAEELARWGIEVHLGQRLKRVEDGAVLQGAGARQPYDVLVAPPTHVAAMSWAPLPLDERGFVQTEAASRQVQGHAGIYAVGDAADYPVKQAYLALLQADAAAEHLSAQVLGAEPDFVFNPRSLWLMEQMDQAMFLQIPLGPPEPDDEARQVERLPTGQIRRMHVRALFPRHFDTLNPLYAGLLWKGTKVGLKILGQLVREEQA